MSIIVWENKLGGEAEVVILHLVQCHPPSLVPNLLTPALLAYHVSVEVGICSTCMKREGALPPTPPAMLSMYGTHP